MKYWLLKVQRAYGIEEVFDLRKTPVVYIGDETSNEVCLETIAVPSRLPVVKMGIKGPKLQLTKEVESSLSGQTEKRKAWKTKLYEGFTYQVLGPCSWNIEGVRFELFTAEIKPLTNLKEDRDPLIRKHLFQSLGFSAVTHLSIFLIVLGFGFVFEKLQAPKEELKAQKISIQQVSELFKAPEPEPLEELKPPPPKEVPQKIEKRTEKTRKSAQAAKSAASNTGSRPAAVAPGKGSKTEVTGMGLLAIQTANTSNADRSLRLDKPQVNVQVAEAEIGASFSSTGLGIRSGKETKSVAMLGGISGSSYQSGALSSKVTAGDGKGIQLVRKEVEIRGGLDPAIIQQIIEERLSEVRYCYENALLSKANLSGKISTSWTIQADGSVTNLVSNSEDLSERTLHDCIKDRIARWRFPQPKGGGVVHVKYPFVFSSLGS